MSNMRGKSTRQALDRYNRWLKRTHKQPGAISTAIAGRPMPESVKKWFGRTPYYMQAQEQKMEDGNKTGN